MSSLYYLQKMKCYSVWQDTAILRKQEWSLALGCMSMVPCLSVLLNGSSYRAVEHHGCAPKTLLLHTPTKTKDKVFYHIG